MDIGVHIEERENYGLSSSHILPTQSPLADFLVAPEDSAWLQFPGVNELVDPTINEGVQLHGSMVSWRILDLFISADQSYVIVSEIILPMQIMTDQLGLSSDPLMIVLDAY